METPSALPEAMISSASAGERMEPMTKTGILTRPEALIAAERSVFSPWGR